MMFNKILIANRGEIAVRIIRACHEMGIQAVAIFSDCDRTSPHVLYADEAYPVGPPSPAESYLNVQKILTIARQCDADAVHPGYGFLSENADLAQRVIAEGLKWIGPPPSAMQLLGDKIEAKKLAKQCGLPIVPGILTTHDKADNERFVQEVGFPLLVKAVGGGGGKGMRLVTDVTELESALLQASREAASSFSDDRVYIEKCFTHPRHIEIQVMADEFGTIRTFPERECSIQRRFQKIIEETPSAYISRETWKQMSKLAGKLLNKAKYIGAGTVEFLVVRPDEYYFLEVNTRLQVEHPITEMISGIDLVKEQIQIAAGNPLTFDTIHAAGHAIECRIYAEDGFQNFLPDTGIIVDLSIPGGKDVRFDHFLRNGLQITPYYDPLLGKLIVHAPDRQSAIRKMKQALSECNIDGVQTTLPFCFAVMNHPSFENGDYDTNFISDESGTLQELSSGINSHLAVAALIAGAFHKERKAHPLQLTNSRKKPSRWKTIGRKERLR